jgi:hypothetical protein
MMDIEEEKTLFKRRIYLLLPSECWEPLTAEGRHYGPTTHPIWRGGGRKNEYILHAAVRLFGTLLDPPTILDSGERVTHRPSCVTPYCCNPLHLSVERRIKPREKKEVPSGYRKILDKPPPSPTDEEGNITGPSPVYVMDVRVRPMLDENEYPPKKKIHRPGFAGKHSPLRSEDS